MYVTYESLFVVVKVVNHIRHFLGEVNGYAVFPQGLTSAALCLVETYT